jgi:hypothetical protein
LGKKNRISLTEQIVQIPATDVAIRLTASAKSKGARLVLATNPIKNTINIGNKGTINYTAL